MVQVHENHNRSRLIAIIPDNPAMSMMSFHQQQKSCCRLGRVSSMLNLETNLRVSRKVATSPREGIQKKSLMIFQRNAMQLASNKLSLRVR